MLEFYFLAGYQEHQLFKSYEAIVGEENTANEADKTPTLWS